MIHKLTVWKVTVTDTRKGPYLYRVWTGKFLGKPDNAKIAEAILDEARSMRAAADELTNTPDKEGWWVGGGPSNGELAGGLLETVAKMEALAALVQAGGAEIKFNSYQIIEADGIHRRTVDTLAGWVTPQTIRLIDLYPVVQVWLQYATLVYGVTLEQIEEWARTDGLKFYPNCEYIERKLCLK